MIHKIILGTYTRRISQGIYQIELDTATETLNNLQLVTEETSPTYFAKAKRAFFTQSQVEMVTAGCPVTIHKTNF